MSNVKLARNAPQRGNDNVLLLQDIDTNAQCIYALGHTCMVHDGVATYNLLTVDMRKAGAFDIRGFQNFAEVRAAGEATYVDTTGAPTSEVTARFTLTELGWERFETVRHASLQTMIDLTTRREHRRARGRSGTR